MKTNIFIPEKINAGFQNRTDTYTKKLAYVIYFDQKGVLRKESSWNGWRDKSIDNVIHDNIPTSGFVLNKKAGGYSTGWNHRQTYVRVYDPRDFEFEISISNLLYILENTNSIKGKGLEGDFVYGFDGKDLLLIPTSSPDYIEISQFNKILHEKNYVKSKELVIGGTYKSKDNTEYIYMGRFDLKDTKSERVEVKNGNGNYGRTYNYVNHNVNKGKYYFFTTGVREGYDGNKYLSMLTLKSLGDKFIETTSTECVDNYAELFEYLERSTDYSHYDKTKDEHVPFTLDEFKEFVSEKKLDSYSYNRRFTLRTSGYNKEEIHFNNDKKEYYKQGTYISNKGYEEFPIGDIEQVFNKFEPIYKNEYLENGKLYRRVTSW
ncbi:hypothetical protein BC351_01105 [Paenibacillus ferrarius]|uniref:Uncharacterized protein n=1 Tax=Paenibacillus ferrarius TaxID=1469647 RepID=A0A1V4HSE5_9BACL|nr:hypothetical protein [Paenibacillus ferrarius]OPH61869.1 hypothetical protein BC351_01105 [Paenibacillus ferrarius]